MARCSKELEQQILNEVIRKQQKWTNEMFTENNISFPHSQNAAEVAVECCNKLLVEKEILNVIEK